VKEEISEDEDIIESDYLIKEFTKIEVGRNLLDQKVVVVGNLGMFVN
jgi:hypothetical protein